jgi:hypothetical protein
MSPGEHSSVPTTPGESNVCYSPTAGTWFGGNKKTNNKKIKHAPEKDAVTFLDFVGSERFG